MKNSIPLTLVGLKLLSGIVCVLICSAQFSFSQHTINKKNPTDSLEFEACNTMDSVWVIKAFYFESEKNVLIGFTNNTLFVFFGLLTQHGVFYDTLFLEIIKNSDQMRSILCEFKKKYTSQTESKYINEGYIFANFNGYIFDYRNIKVEDKYSINSIRYICSEEFLSKYATPIDGELKAFPSLKRTNKNGLWKTKDGYLLEWVRETGNVIKYKKDKEKVIGIYDPYTGDEVPH